MTKRWYVVQSKSNEEFTALKNLKAQRYTVFFPQIEKSRSIRKESILVLTPLFPSYLFVQFDIGRAKWRSIMGTRGVSKLLGYANDYASPLPKGLVEDFIKKADKRGCVSLYTAEKIVDRYKVGDQLTVKTGVFTGLTGTCRKIRKDFAYIILSLQTKTFEVRLPLSLVEIRKQTQSVT